jgi:hypothetical protein
MKLCMMKGKEYNYSILESYQNILILILFHSSSQDNINYEETIKTLGLETKPHPNTYPL